MTIKPWRELNFLTYRSIIQYLVLQLLFQLSLIVCTEITLNKTVFNLGLYCQGNARMQVQLTFNYIDLFNLSMSQSYTNKVCS